MRIVARLTLCVLVALCLVGCQTHGRPADSRAKNLPVTEQPRVLLVSNGNYFLEQALDSLEWADVTTVPPSRYQDVATNRYSAVVFDRYEPRAIPSHCGALFIGFIPTQLDPPADAAGKPEKLADVSVLEWRRDHPATRGLDLQKLYVAEALKMPLLPHWETLVEGSAGPLIAARGSSEGGPIQIVVAFDLQESNWPLQSAFPAFIDQSLTWLCSSESESVVIRYFRSLKG